MDNLDDESDSDEDRLSAIMPHQSASLMVTESADGYLVVVVVRAAILKRLCLQYANYRCGSTTRSTQKNAVLP